MLRLVLPPKPRLIAQSSRQFDRLPYRVQNVKDGEKITINSEIDKKINYTVQGTTINLYRESLIQMNH